MSQEMIINGFLGLGLFMNASQEFEKFFGPNHKADVTNSKDKVTTACRGALT
jgi:hypothetical protein